jgi:translation elongation factor EF-1alpha
MGVFVMGKIESGSCRVGDRCILMPNRTHVEVTNIYYKDIETVSCVCGKNVRLKLKNVAEVRSFSLTNQSLISFFLCRKSFRDIFCVIINKNLVELDEPLTLK